MMKRLIPIFLLLIACSNSSEEFVSTASVDTVSVAAENKAAIAEADSIKEEILAEKRRVEKTKDSALIAQNIKLDTLYKYIEIYKDSVDKLKEIRAMLKGVHVKNTFSIDSLQILRNENRLIKKEYRKLAENSAQIKKEIASIKNKLSNPTVAAVSVKCYGFKSRFLKKTTQYETDVAKNIKRIVVQFTIPANDLIEKRTYSFNIRITGVLNKSLIVKLTGEEVNIDPVVFDIIDVLESGSHVVVINVDGKNEFSYNLDWK